MKFSVYILRSQQTEKTYIGYTSNLRRRITEHQKGLSPYTKSLGHCDLIWCSFFREKSKALTFEKYLKTGSGRAFMKKHLI